MSDTPVYFVPNNVRPTWPTLDEVLRWANQNSAANGPVGQVAEANAERFQLALDAAVERISKRCHLQVRPVDAGGAVDEGGDPVEIPAGVKLATIKQSVRWARRAMTPDGIAGSSEITGLIRTTALDPDIEAELELWLELAW